MYLKFIQQSIEFTFRYILRKIQIDNCGNDEVFLRGVTDSVRSFLGNSASQTVS